jgi:hypothetical protein
LLEHLSVEHPYLGTGHHCGQRSRKLPAVTHFLGLHLLWIILMVLYYMYKLYI